MQNYKYLNNINFPSDIKKLNNEELKVLSEEVRSEMIDAVSKTGGHLGAGLGVVELTDLNLHLDDRLFLKQHQSFHFLLHLIELLILHYSVFLYLKEN